MALILLESSACCSACSFSTRLMAYSILWATRSSLTKSQRSELSSLSSSLSSSDILGTPLILRLSMSSTLSSYSYELSKLSRMEEST